MADWRGVSEGISRGFERGLATGGGRLGHLGGLIAKVADKLRTERETQKELGMKQNLLGYAGLTEGKISQAQPNEAGAFQVPGIGWMKKSPTPDEAILNRLFPQGQSAQGQNQNIMGQDWKMNKVDLGPVTLERQPTPEETQQTLQKKTQETQATEAGRPYGETEAGVISKSKLLTPEINKLIKLIEDKDIYEGFKIPGGASRISAFGKPGSVVNPIRRMLTAGPGREAGLLLQKIRTLEFGEGGKNLTEAEKAVIEPLLDPQYKTEKQWAGDLKYVSSLLNEKAKLMTKAPVGSVQSNTQPNNQLDNMKSKYGLD